MTKVLAGRENAAKQQRCINGRDLGPPSSFAGLPINKVIKPSMFVRRSFGVETKCGEHPFASRLPINPATFGADAQGSETKSSSGAAGDVDASMTLIIGHPVCPGAIGNKSGPGVSLLPKEAKRAS